MADNQDDSFSASKAEVFEALSHPTRIRLLQTLSDKPLPFSELKRAAGLESNGLLTFHLGKLSGLVRLNPEGAYALTDEGREALRIVEASKNQSQERSFQGPSIHVPHLKIVLVGLVVVLVILASASAIEYNQIQGLRPQGTVTVTIGIPTTVTTIMTTAVTTAIAVSPCMRGATLMTINGSAYCATDISKDIEVQSPGYSYFLNGSVTFMGVKFTTWCPPAYAGCPNQSNSTITVYTVLAAGAIRFNMTFPDKSVESTGAVIGDSDYVLILSSHVDPRAGMLIQYGSASYTVFLLVEDNAT